MTIETVEDAFEAQLEELYYIENELEDVYGALGSDTRDNKLSQTFEEFQEETIDQQERTEQVFEAIDKEPDQISLETIDALREDLDGYLTDITDEDLQTLALTAGVIEVERLEKSAIEYLLRGTEYIDVPEEAIDALEQNLEETETAIEEVTDAAEDVTDVPTR
jgi:ferritin-like metal-binding protein YciE